MRRIVLLLLTAVLICGLLSGCDLWMDGEYHNVEPHREDNEVAVPENVEVNTYAQLRQAFVDLVESGSQSGLIYIPNLSPEQARTYTDNAIRHVTQSNAIGAYAVSEITCELGANAGIYAAAVNISYIHGRSEILRIKQVKTMTDAEGIIQNALKKCDPGAVFCVEAYSSVDFTQKIQDYVDTNPDICMEMPQVSVSVYPEQGKERIVELTFSYQTSRETLRSMQDTVEPVFASAELYVSGDAESREKYAQLYSFLMERYHYTLETSITPSYSLLRHGVGDSKAFATVYAAMCRRAGLDCRVVSGTRVGEARYWNVILEDGTYYHVDLLQCSQMNGFAMNKAEQMSGYVWDYAEYPDTVEFTQ